MPPVRWSLWVLLRWVMEGSSPGVGSRRAALSAAGGPAWSGPAAAAKDELARHDVVQSSLRVPRPGPWSHPSSAARVRFGAMTTLLVVHHSPTRSLQALTEAVLAGAHDDAIEGVEVVARPALEATADDVLAADGYLLGTSANFGYMSGALKHFFDSTFLAVGGSLSDDGSARGSSGG